MKVRVKFSKTGNMKFVGHLDVMRYFQKVNRRAGIDIAYSGGFSPHQIMSFASPLGLGLTSEGEYLDMELNSSGTSAMMMERMNAVMAEGFEVVGCFKLPDSAANAMSIVAAADYQLTLRPGYEVEQPEEWVQGLLDFYGQDEVLISKKTKKGEKQLDLKQLVYELSASMEDGSPVIFMKISTGSTENIKPELVLDAYYQHRGEERPAFAWMTCRREVYADLAPEQKKEQGLHQFIPLMDLGETIA